MARTFNGTTDGIDMGNPSPLSALNSGVNTLTISAWVYGTSSTADGFIFGDNYSGGENFMVRWNRSSSGTIDGLVFNNTFASSLLHSVTTTTSAANTWTHVALTWNGTNTRIWINGTNEATGSLGGAGLNPGQTGYHWQIGRDFANNGTTFTGRIAECAIWNATLTATEIAGLAKGARAYRIRTPSLQGWWPVDGIQSPEPDLSGKKDSGTVTGTTSSAGPPYMAFTPRWPLGGIFPTTTPPVFILMPQIVT
jgi:hypothetical protein